MKKLISAASAMAMVASLVGSAIPFSAVAAAEASKTLSLKAFVDKDNKAVSTTISAADIAAGDVTIPVGLYYTEKVADTLSIRASFGVSSKDGDASKVYFDGPSGAPYEGNSEYFNAPRAVTAASGEVETNRLGAFAGKLADTRNGVKFSSLGTYTCNLDTKQNSQNWDTAWASLIWTQPVSDGGKYAWCGEASDSFPCMVLDCVFPKGTPAGTYTIEFISMNPDPKFPSVWSTMIESGAESLTYIEEDGNLICKDLTITIEGDSSGGGNNNTGGGNNNTGGGNNNTGGGNNNTGGGNNNTGGGNNNTGGGNNTGGTNTQKDFIVRGNEVKYDPSKATYIDFYVEANGHKGVMMGFEIAEPPAGIKAEVTDPYCYSFPNTPEWTLMTRTWSCKCMDPSTQDPREFNEDEIVVGLELTVPDGIKAGTYEIGFERFHVVEQPNELIGPILEFDATVVPGKLIVGEGGSGNVVTTTLTTTVVSTTTTTTTALDPSKPLYGDANNDKKVNIADVVVLNKWLNDNSAYAMSAQGKLNADCCDASAGTPDENDSKAIIQSLVHLVTLPCKAADLK